MRPLAALAALLLVAGCSTNREDQAFFETGWVKPQEGSDRRLYGVPKAAEPEPEDTPPARPAGRK